MTRRVIAVVVALVVLASIAGASGARSGTTAFRITPALRNFTDPVLLTSAPGEPNVLYVVEQGGRILRIANGRRTVFLDVSSVITAGGEQGLLGLAFDPRYAANRLFYVGYTSRTGFNTVARVRSNGKVALPGSRKVLIAVRDPYSNHNGGNLAFGRDDALYTSFGDGGAGGDPENRAQNMASPFGKLLRIAQPSGAAKWSIVADGLRNPWRFSFDRSTGDLWIGDVGQDSVEEVDHVASGWSGVLNFGWDVYEGNQSYESKALGPGTLVQPVATYTHDVGCSVTGGYVYRGAAVPAAAGRYFYGDYCSGTIWSIPATGGPVRQEPFTVSNLSSFGEDSRGELYLVSHGGTIYRLRG